MNLLRSKHYTHLSLADTDGIYRPSPLLIVGGSSSGKSMTGEKIIEKIEDNIPHTITIMFVDYMNTFEGGFSMFPADESSHKKALEFQQEEPKPRNGVKLHYLYGKDLKFMAKNLPQGDIITFSAKKLLQREEISFLLEQNKETKSVRLMLKAGEMLKKNESLKIIPKYLKELTQKKKTFYMGKPIETEDEVIGDKSDIKEVRGSLQLFDYDNNIMPDNFAYNFDAKNLFKESGVRHIFIYKGLKKDSKLRDFFVFHLINEVVRIIEDVKYPTILCVEEIQSIAPDEKEGYRAIMGQVIGKHVGTVRKTARGVSFLLLGTEWNRISDKIRGQVTKQLIFKLELGDMLKFVKAGNLGKREKMNIERLSTGLCILKGDEQRVIQAKVPCHGHKHTTQDFMSLYKKYFPEKIIDYSSVIHEINEEQKIQKGLFKQHEKEIEEAKKANIRKQIRNKNVQKGDNKEFEKMKERERERKEEERLLRNNLIMETYKELKNSNKKASYRIIADLVSKKGIKVSYVTVKYVIDNFLTSTGGGTEKI